MAVNTAIASPGALLVARRHVDLLRIASALCRRLPGVPGERGTRRF
ncbi:putative leader peptide [Haloactinospora alba]